MNDKEIIEKINSLKKERRAVILAHNYQRDEVQRIADLIRGHHPELADALVQRWTGSKQAFGNV